MEEKVLLQQGNNLQIKFDVTHAKDKKMLTHTSRKHFCGGVYFQLQAISTRCVGTGNSYADIITIISIRFMKVFKDDFLTYTCKFASDELENVVKKITESDTWHQVYVINHPDTNENTTMTFIASFNSNIYLIASPFSAIYNDTDSTDFKLCGEEDAVDMHKLVLKASSPFFEGMLSGEWKETSEGEIKIKEASKETLEHFKDYIYLNELPNTGLEQLLLLGSYFMMPDLVQKCLVKLLNKLDSENFEELLEFAAKFKVKNLLVTLLRLIKQGLINIDNLSENALADMCQATNNVLTFKK